MGFLARTLTVLLVLYGLVFVVADLALLHADAPLWVGFAFAVVFIGLQYLAAPWFIERVFSIDFSADAMPAAQREFRPQGARGGDLAAAARRFDQGGA